MALETTNFLIKNSGVSFVHKLMLQMKFIGAIENLMGHVK